MVKAQVLTGGRGKAGGIRLAQTPAEAEKATETVLALTIKGFPVREVLIGRAAAIANEYYLALAVDRTTRTIECMISEAGGVDIEETAATCPDKILKVFINPLVGPEHSRLDDALSAVLPKKALPVKRRPLSVICTGCSTRRTVHWWKSTHWP